MSPTSVSPTTAHTTPSSASITTSHAHDLHDLLSTTLFSTSDVVAYSVPLILISTPLVFAGAFLTLDRTRSFTPRHPLSTHPRTWFGAAHVDSFLRAGVGGLAIGFAFGAHCTTFLSLLIPSSTNSPPLSATAFLAVYLLSAVACAIAAGRWQYVAQALCGITGFASLSLSLSVMLHPTLLARIILTAMLTILGLLLCFIPILKYRRVAIRTAAAATGSFGVVLSISLLAHVPAWSNIWARLWVNTDVEWGTLQEKGLSAAYCIMAAFGVTCDWFLHHQFGENPDEQWDSYLAEYGDNIPTDKDRAGMFEPTRSLWDRLFGRHPPAHRLLQLHNRDFDEELPSVSLLPPERRSRRSQVGGLSAKLSDHTPPVGFLRHVQKPFKFTRTGRSDERKIHFTSLLTPMPTLGDAEANFSTPSESHNALQFEALYQDALPHSVRSEAEGIRSQFWRDVKAKADEAKSADYLS